MAVHVLHGAAAGGEETHARSEPMTSPAEVLLRKHTRREFRQRMQAGELEACIVPVAAIEQHLEHLAMEHDWRSAVYVARSRSACALRGWWPKDRCAASASITLRTRFRGPDGENQTHPVEGAMILRVEQCSHL